MELLRKDRLFKLKKKNKGNTKLLNEIDKLISDIENAEWNKPSDIKETRPDADRVHSDGFYFFDIHIHRTMILVVFDENEAVVIWTGSHDEYDKTFKGNKKTIDLIMERLAINNIQKLNELKNELEYERASSLYLKLRKLEKEDSNYTPIRKHLRKLILQYEKDHWADESQIEDKQIEESDLAESLVRSENEFYQKRKELIREKLKESGLNQNDLAKILGHRKSYMSELINGLRPFSKEDLVIINRLFGIKLEELIPPFIKQNKAKKVRDALNSLPNSKIKLSKRDFDLHIS